MITTTPPPSAGHDIPTRKLGIFAAIVAVGLLVYFTGIKPAVHHHTLTVRAERRAACGAVSPEVESAILGALTDTGGRDARSLRSKPSDGGWTFVSGDFAEPGVPRGFTGEIATWRVRTDDGLVIQSVDKNARDFSAFERAPTTVSVRDAGGFDSRWCAKNAALSP